jgi:CRISPR-associated protein Csm3
MNILKEKLLIKGTAKLVTGLHIGDSKDTVDIGGVDSPIIRRKDNNQPYIPGSSLKGKIRCLLQLVDGEADERYAPNSRVCELFGALPAKGDRDSGIASRIIVRDAFMTPGSAAELAANSMTDLPYSEVKVENRIDRIKGAAEHPRQIERVPAGAAFALEFIINVMVDEREHTDPAKVTAKRERLLHTFHEGIRLLRHDYLGGNGSRGYGQLEIALEAPVTVYPAQQ